MPDPVSSVTNSAAPTPLQTSALGLPQPQETNTSSAALLAKGDQVGRSAPKTPGLYDDSAAFASTAQPGRQLDAAAPVGQATNSAGQVDTQRLAHVVAGAAQSDFGKASSAYAGIKSNLELHDSSAVSSFDDAVVRAFSRGVADATAGVSTGLSSAGKKTLVNNPILMKRWVSTTSSWTGKDGFTDGLYDLLEGHNIQVQWDINARPPGSVGKSSGVVLARANNTNGALARDAIAAEYRAQGHQVSTEVPRENGTRRVDVRVDMKAKDPRNNVRIEIESKVGRTSQSPAVAAQAAKDGRALAENAAIRSGGKALETVGKVMLPVAAAADAVQLGQAFHADGNRVGENTGRAASGIAGSWGGAVAGAEVGAAVGSVVPGVGTVVGGVVGGIVGGIAGDWAGRSAFNELEQIL